MQFYAISIFLHRPFFSRSAQRSVGEDQQESAQERQICVEAAQAIVRILQAYRKQHSLRQTNVQIVHLVFTASLIHIYTICTSTGIDAEKSMVDLQTCCQALSEIGQTYKNSTRALEVIICIKREWQGKAYSTHFKRPSSYVDGTTNSAGNEKRKKRVVYGSKFDEAARPGDLAETAHEPHYTSRVRDGVSSNFEVSNGILEERYPDLDTISTEDPFAFGFLHTVPPCIEFSEEGLNLLNSLE
jgi:hypothetical protein